MNVKIFLAIIPALLMATTVLAAHNIQLDYIEAEDIDNPEDLMWGQAVSEITQSTTAYGGILGDGKDARMVEQGYWKDGAEYTFAWDKGAAQTIVIRHLDGIADDGFTIEALHCNGEWVEIGTYVDNGLGTEEWFTTEFFLSDDYGESLVCKGKGKLQIRITVTDDEPWSGFNQWGQVAIDWLELRGNGKPR